MARLPGYLSANQKMRGYQRTAPVGRNGRDALSPAAPCPAPCRDDALQLNVNTLQARPAPLLMALFPAGVNLQQARQLLQDRARPVAGTASPLSLSQPIYSKRYRRRPLRG